MVSLRLDIIQIGNEVIVDPYSLAQPDGNRSCQGPRSQCRNSSVSTRQDLGKVRSGRSGMRALGFRV